MRAGIQPSHADKLRRLLARLDHGSHSQDMDVPGWKLHPGLTLRDDVLPTFNLSVTQAAEQLGVSRVALIDDRHHPVS
jgi:hypothetical protein